MLRERDQRPLEAQARSLKVHNTGEQERSQGHLEPVDMFHSTRFSGTTFEKQRM